ncbi:hypothetical protein D3C81_2010130 [compost metagenome]
MCRIPPEKTGHNTFSQRTKLLFGCLYDHFILLKKLLLGCQISLPVEAEVNPCMQLNGPGVIALWQVNSGGKRTIM